MIVMYKKENEKMALTEEAIDYITKLFQKEENNEFLTNEEKAVIKQVKEDLKNQGVK